MSWDDLGMSLDDLKMTLYGSENFWDVFEITLYDLEKSLDGCRISLYHPWMTLKSPWVTLEWLWMTIKSLGWSWMTMEYRWMTYKIQYNSKIPKFDLYDASVLQKIFCFVTSDKKCMSSLKKSKKNLKEYNDKKYNFSSILT